MSGAVCPSCQGSTMIQTREWVDRRAMTRTCDFMCSACGATVEISGGMSADLVAAINDYPYKGFVPMGVLSLSVQPPAPVIMPAGSSWFTQPVSVPSGVLTFAPSYDPPREPEPKKSPAPEPEKVIEGAVIGYRAWRIKDWALTGTGVNRAWHPGVNEATCDAGNDSAQWRMALGAGHGKHPAPHIGCHCGITALARFAENDQHWPDDAIPGAIEAWSDEDPSGDGRFILHGTGFRAQYGKVVLLAVDDDWPTAKKAAVRALAAEHGADVCKRSHLEDAAKEHGQLVPDELLAWAKDAPPPEGSMQALSHQMMILAGQMTISTNQLRQSLSYLSSPPTTVSRPKPTRKGVKQTLGYPGPPQGRLTTYRKGDRVRDKKGQVWECVKGGKPGRWEAEGDQQGGGS